MLQPSGETQRRNAATGPHDRSGRRPQSLGALGERARGLADPRSVTTASAASAACTVMVGSAGSRRGRVALAPDAAAAQPAYGRRRQG